MKNETVGILGLIVMGVIVILLAISTVLLFRLETEKRTLQEQVEMQSLYYELKMDYYEERYSIDLDATPEDFELYLYDNYRELYDYLVEELK